jgi:hypothetical protein
MPTAQREFWLLVWQVVDGPLFIGVSNQVVRSRYLLISPPLVNYSADFLVVSCRELRCFLILDFILQLSTIAKTINIQTYESRIITSDV